ncbi:MAG: hypothetical protein WC028_22990 [Candidatus Obscuribacterales bacterium]|jgi:hypothetical protein
MSKSLELYINAIVGGYHTLMVVEGVRREKAPFTANDHQEMLAEALRLLEGEGFDGQLRIFDSGNVMVRNRDGQSSLTTKQLRMFVTIPGGPIHKVEPDPTQYEPHRSTDEDEAARNLGRHLMA